jgi:type I restriction enzyme S subunit
MSEWKEVQLITICDKIGSGATPRGGKDAYQDEGISLIRSQNVHDFRFRSDGLAFINEEQAYKLKNVIVEENDVLVNITGDSVARVCSAPKEFVPARVNQHVAIIRPKSKELNWEFLKYFLLSPYQKVNLLMLSSSGATRNALTKGMLENLKINLPPPPEQKAIAHILGTLDNKIELNRRQNETLEAMAQALFKSWFVDFDPVLDNALAAGNIIPPALQKKAAQRQAVAGEKKLAAKNPALAQLFPASFEFNEELGKWVPEGWEDDLLENLINHQKGYAFKSKWYQDYGKIVVRVSDTTEDSIDINSCNRIAPEIANQYRAYRLKENDVIIATVGSWPPNYSSVVGKVIRVPSTAKGGLLNQNAVRLTIKNELNIHQGFLYYNLKSMKFMDFIVNRAQGSANQASITLKSIFSYPIIMANHDILDSFSSIVKRSIDQQNVNLKQTETLTQLRDTLLPQLISGKLRLSSKAMIGVNETID